MIFYHGSIAFNVYASYILSYRRRASSDFLFSVPFPRDFHIPSVFLSHLDYIAYKNWMKFVLRCIVLLIIMPSKQPLRQQHTNIYWIYMNIRCDCDETCQWSPHCDHITCVWAPSARLRYTIYWLKENAKFSLIFFKHTQKF